ncbi:MAG: hypothetical protein JSV91_11735 [Phycisphaerales bacterium]|nr:MAG: hypothetical protein JSV91_11735 [Phycisphaerales bacterium]
MTARIAALVLLPVTLLLLTGCATDPAQGYTTASCFPTEYRTVAVPIFTNDTYERGMEYGLTQAVIKEIESRTPYKVVSQARADTTLVGRIRRIDREQLSKSRRTGLTEEMLLRVTIDFEWKDLRTNKAIVQRLSFTGHGLFVPSNPTGEPLELGQFAVAQTLAEDIVDEMRADW